MDEAYAQRFSTFWCGDHRALSEAFTQQAVSVWQYLSSQENYQPFINDRFSAHPGMLPEVPINSSLWWSFLLRNNSSYLVFEKEIDAAFEKYRAAPNHPVFALKKAAVVTLPDILDQLEQVKKLEIVETRIFSFPRSLEKLVNVIDLRLDNNSLSYVRIGIPFLVNFISNFGKIPECIADNMLSLESLSVKSNFIKSLPANLSKLHQLKRLYLDDNVIETLNLDGGQLTSLTVLSVAGNKLSNLSPEVARLKQ